MFFNIHYLFLLFSAGCWGGEETKNVSCASLRTGNAYKYCVKDKEKPKCVEWQSVDSNKVRYLFIVSHKTLVTTTTDDVQLSNWGFNMIHRLHYQTTVESEI